MDMLPVESRSAERLRAGTDEIAILTTSAQTDGALLTVEVTMQPGGGPPVLHRHDPGEVYHVLRGEFTFYIEDSESVVRRVTAKAGEVVPLAGRTPHTVRNESAEEAVAFVVHAPGSPMENFLRAAAALSEEESRDMNAVLAVANQNGVELLGPIPSTVS